MLGLVRPSALAIEHTMRLPGLKSYFDTRCLMLEYCDIRHPDQVREALERHTPFWIDEVYHLAAETTVREPFTSLEAYRETSAYATNYLGTKNVLDAVVALCDPEVRVLLAGTSQMFGESAVSSTSLNEDTPMKPTTVYGYSKVMAHTLGIEYSSRQDHPIRVCTAILFYHKSWLSQGFLWDQVIGGLLRHKTAPGMPRAEPIVVGSFDSRIDFGWPGDYADAMRRIIQQRADQPSDMRDYVVATGKLTSVREFVELAARTILPDDPLDSLLCWQGKGKSERLLWGEHPIVVVDPSVNNRKYPELVYQGDSSRLQKELGWQPTTRLDEMIRLSAAAPRVGYRP